MIDITSDGKHDQRDMVYVFPTSQKARSSYLNFLFYFIICNSKRFIKLTIY